MVRAVIVKFQKTTKASDVSFVIIARTEEMPILHLNVSLTGQRQNGLQRITNAALVRQHTTLEMTHSCASMRTHARTSIRPLVINVSDTFCFFCWLFDRMRMVVMFQLCSKNAMT